MMAGVRCRQLFPKAFGRLVRAGKRELQMDQVTSGKQKKMPFVVRAPAQMFILDGFMFILRWLHSIALLALLLLLIGTVKSTVFVLDPLKTRKGKSANGRRLRMKFATNS